MCKDMKINRIKSKFSKIRKYSDNIFMNIYYFLRFCFFLGFLFLGIVLLLIIPMFIADFLAHDTLNKIDEKTTFHIFDQLKSSHQYHEAIYLMEYKKDLLDNSMQVLEYNMELTDCYIHVGDYSSAEKYLLEIYRDPSSIIHNEKLYDAFISSKKEAKSFVQFSVARSLFQLYDKMGDKNNQTLYFHKMKEHYNNSREFVMSESIQKALKKRVSLLSFGYNYNFDASKLLAFDEICVQYYTDRNDAIRALMQYIERIHDDKTIGPSYKIKVLNKLIGWLLENKRMVTSYKYISIAVEFAKQLNLLQEYSVVGELSDYCYEAHDIETSRKLFRLYQKYLDETYEEEDLEYLMNHVRSFRYLEADGKWDVLIDNLIDCCEGMRKQVAKNISSMNEDQREYFAKMLDVPFEYASDLLQRRQSSELANLCFDNIAFKSGLLLRSNISLRNRIEKTKDASLIAKYDSLVKLQRELVYESVSKNTFNYLTKTNLRSRVEDLEKEIAMISTDFRYRDSFVQSRWKDVQKGLNRNEAIVELVESKEDCYALILKSKGDVEYAYISSKDSIYPKLNSDIEKFYYSEDITSLLWNEVANHIEGCSKIYYFPVGVFNNISLGSLYWGERSFLCDKYDLELMSNPSEIQRAKTDAILVKNVSNVSLWGGIDYGTSMTLSISSENEHRAISRGDSLKYLTYSYDEVMKISRQLDDLNIENNVYTKNDATEKSFWDRESLNDVILHVSSHGYFNDASFVTNKRSPMYNCGLFFAGSNKYWVNDSIPSDTREDGILRAAEIATMDFTNCELVILSACETGLGYNDTSEGVYGLQRAFRLAGANKILMSLWKVGDEPTSLLMQEFYKSLLNGNSPNHALSVAKSKVRKLYKSPKDWGGFVILN